jgi:hypothetical protein
MPAFRNGSLLPTTPARIGVCSPITYATDRPIGAIERRTRITVWTNDPAAGAARRIGSAAGTITDVADLFAMSDGGRLVGNRALRQALAGDQRKNGCHCEDRFSHERPVRSVDWEMLSRKRRKATMQTSLRSSQLDRAKTCCSTATCNLFDNIRMEPDCTETRRHPLLAKDGSVRAAGHARRGNIAGQSIQALESRR